MTISRRDFLASVAATMALPGESFAELPMMKTEVAKTAASDVRRQPKNVLLMITDDLGFGDLGCYGSPLPTPNLDRLAAGGMRFEHFNAGHPICSASRAALLTGRYAQRSKTVGALFPHAAQGMSLDETTLADLFRGKGFHTKAIGKWHLGDAPDYLPTRRGFESFYGVPYSDDMQPLPLLRDEQVLEADTNRNLLTPRYTDEAVRFLKEASADQPFFLYVAYSYPHDPAKASPRFRGKTGFGDYGDAVAEVDWSVGEIVRTLEEEHLLEDTLVIFTSDHGPWFQGNTRELRGRKCSTFEGGFRVPMIAHWPAAIPAGVVSKEWTSNLDVLPTLARLCELSSSAKPLDGIDISPTLRGAAGAVPLRTLLYFTPFTSGGADLHCARKGAWKLRFAQNTGEIYINDYTAGHESYWLARPELYNLDRDPGESYDVAAEHPDCVHEILDDVRTQMTEMPDQVRTAFAQLQSRVALPSTPTGAAPRPNLHKPPPAWAWEPKERRE